MILFALRPRVYLDDSYGDVQLSLSPPFPRDASPRPAQAGKRSLLEINEPVPETSAAQDCQPRGAATNRSSFGKPVLPSTPPTIMYSGGARGGATHSDGRSCQFSTSLASFNRAAHLETKELSNAASPGERRISAEQHQPPTTAFIMHTQDNSWRQIETLRTVPRSHSAVIRSVGYHQLRSASERVAKRLDAATSTPNTNSPSPQASMESMLDAGDRISTLRASSTLQSTVKTLS